MEEKNIRKEMEGLWKETFGDSSEYVNLVFDTYFEPENVVYHETDGKIDSALLGVPYEFHSRGGKLLKGLYLCGLATRKHSRRKGIMGNLLEIINRKAEEAGFDFTFLIPAGEGLRRYYADRGYADAFYKVEEHYVRGHKFSSSGGILLKRYEPALKETVMRFLSEQKTECNENEYQLVHSPKDWEAVLEESVVSDEPVFLAVKNENLMGVVFTKRGENETIVKELLAFSDEEKVEILEKLSETFPERNLTLVRNLEDALRNPANRLWSPFYGSNNPPSSQYEEISEKEIPYDPSRGAKSFGMLRIFNLHGLLQKSGIDDKELKGFSKEELQKIILRRPVAKQADGLEKILGFPELSFNICLLLE